jgi:hypothetical protein
MKFSEVELPSNRKFGFFFAVIFVITSAYFWLNESVTIAYTFAALATTFLIVTLLKADLLFPLNQLWMRFGLLLGVIVSPIVLGLIFFLMFTPIAFLMRLRGRDELRLKIKERSSHWIKRETPLQTDSFKQQF